jgi:hypothetical protein
MNSPNNHKSSLPAWQLAKMRRMIGDRWKEVWEIVESRLQHNFDT